MGSYTNISANINITNTTKFLVSQIQKIKEHKFIKNKDVYFYGFLNCNEKVSVCFNSYVISK